MSDRELAEIHAALTESQIYVHPDLAASVTGKELARITTALERADPEVNVVLYPFQRNDEYAGSAADLLTRLHDRYQLDGIYLSTTTHLKRDEYSQIRLEGRQWGVPGERDGDLPDYEVLGAVNQEDHATVGAVVIRTLELLAADPDEVQEAYDEVVEARASTQPAPAPPEPTGDLDPTGMVVAGLVLAVLTAVGWGAVQRRRRPRRQAFALPASALARIRDAQDQRLTRQAGDDVLGLGEAIEAADITASGDPASWQATLDHYDAACRVLDRETASDVLDVVGAIVLAERGRHALAAALAGRPYTPLPRCYLNPLHGKPSGTVTLESDDGRVDVPVCRTCRNDLRAHRIPDTLDVVRRGRAVHYFDAGAEPWSSTGYGTLEPDLVSRLHSDR